MVAGLVLTRMGRALAQISGFAVQYVNRYASISWFTRLVPPSVCGWKAVDKADSIPRCFSRSRNTLAANWDPRSEMILSGSPNLEKALFISSIAVSSEVIIFLQGSSSIPFIRPWSTTTSIESYPDEMGSLVIKSIDN